MRLQCDEHDVGAGDGAHVIGAAGVGGELIVSLPHRDAVGLHRRQVRTAGDEDDVFAASCQMATEKAAYRSGADDGDRHLG